MLVLTGALYAQKQKKIAPSRWNLFSPEQDIQLGREAAAEVERKVAVLDNKELTGFVSRIGKKLGEQPEAGNYPYTFKVVHDNSINAFALPGGPSFVHTGLIQAAGNEAQIAGVLAHEISHVALRHGTAQVTKANAIQIAAGIGGLMAGGSMLGQLAQLGAGLGANSLLLKFSRDAESDADLLGARMMARAGYEPIEMARFFEKLEVEEKARGGQMSQFFSDHPNPGNRVKAVSEEVKMLPARGYGKGDSASLQRAQSVIRSLPVPKKTNANFRHQPPAGGSATGAGIDAARPAAALKQHQSRSVSFSYPENWQVFQSGQSNELTIAATEGLVEGQGGRTEIAFGALAGLAPGRGGLERDTEQFLQQIAPANRMQRSGEAKRFQVSGSAALLNLYFSASPYRGRREVDAIVTVEHPKGLFYMILVSPENEYPKAQPVFDRMIQSIQIAR